MDNLDELMSTMQEVWRSVNSHNKKVWMSKQGTPLQFFTLRFLLEKPEATITDITKHFQITKSSATQLIERLSKQKLVEKISDKEDRRVIHLRLTKKAIKEIAKVRQKRMEEMKRVFSNVHPNDIKDLIRIHKNLLNNLKEGKNINATLN
ncbi:MAG TPA: MarR family transcriptional regulator [Patescibacteria group bacterium]|nr:MarR family transcriptional regulator [Patescibacteria group bacterium]